MLMLTQATGDHERLLTTTGCPTLKKPRTAGCDSHV
jgi:hypothetical protein